jgi:hypothetical protein
LFSLEQLVCAYENRMILLNKPVFGGTNCGKVELVIYNILMAIARPETKVSSIRAGP